MPVDDAHKILDIYASFKAEPGRTLISIHFLAVGERHRWTPHELQAGIEEAHRRGWVEPGRGWTLTQAGFEEMERSLHA